MTNSGAILFTHYLFPGIYCTTQGISPELVNYARWLARLALVHSKHTQVEDASSDLFDSKKFRSVIENSCCLVVLIEDKWIKDVKSFLSLIHTHLISKVKNKCFHRKVQKCYFTRFYWYFYGFLRGNFYLKHFLWQKIQQTRKTGVALILVHITNGDSFFEKRI